MDYISHLDVLNPDASSSLLAAWSNYSVDRNDKVSLVEQLQTTLDVEQLLSIYLNALDKTYQVTAVELETYQGKFKAGKRDDNSHESSLPIRINDRLMGRISYLSGKPISDILMSSLDTYQKSLIFPLRNALAFWKLQQMALKDPLTGIGNRAMFDETLERKIQLSQRNKSSFILLILDLDNFKQVNDCHGHLTGDDILLGFTNLVVQCLRGSDQMFRFGGDEFAILLDLVDTQVAKLVAARIYQAVASTPLFIKYGVGTSIGCARFEQDDTATDLFAKADKALYAAKDAGKNCMKIA